MKREREDHTNVHTLDSTTEAKADSSEVAADTPATQTVQLIHAERLQPLLLLVIKAKNRKFLSISNNNNTHTNLTNAIIAKYRVFPKISQNWVTGMFRLTIFINLNKIPRSQSKNGHSHESTAGVERKRSQYMGIGADRIDVSAKNFRKV